MLSNLVLGPQGSTPAQDTGARVYWDRTVPGKGFGWIVPLSQRGSCEDVGDTVTSYRTTALLGSPAVPPRGGDVPSPSLKDGFLPDGTLWYLNMGNLLKVLTCTDLEQGPNFFLDFENAQPTESEKEIYNQVNVVLKDAEGILEDLQSYRGAGHEIREAIQHPNDEKLQEKAWGAVVPLVGKLKKFYEFSQRLEAGLRGLLGALTSTPYSPTQHLEREQALAKQFAEILHFTLRFDELKMTNPAIQNDFSYYRRTLSRMRINNVPAEGENEVNNELANRMSLFYAEATPMLKTLSDATTKFVSENKNLPIENTTDCLSTMASVCRVMLETPEYRSRFTNEETVSFCLRVMVGVIILYDHVHPVGAFAKTSKIDMKGCIKVLKDQPPNSVEGLLNALRYTTKHLNDETTSKQIKSMLQ
ncbi:CYFIP-related Rac1 interactor B isoform X3 [Motacilla alba alba]|uniref:CYFIP-related Rac1 interactor B isoform X3 n=1 Tax=Motacilla alba alba TaxID=1094192 RepID=UPI0018D577F3|nr:CYFIP-related Rac1 interactor B isoform X3 [Motacilla alba alba]